MKNIYKYNIQVLLLSLGISIVFFKSINTWFFWDINIVVILLFGLICLTLYGKKQSKRNEVQLEYLPQIIIFIVLKLYLVRDFNINGYLGAIVDILFIIYLIQLNDDLKILIFQYLSKAFSLLVGVSIIVWVVHLIGIPLPNEYLSYNNGQYIYNNYYAFLDNIRVPSDLIFKRFSSVFLEPGHLGLISSFFLYANKFDFKKKEVWVFLFAIILSFSLAGYVLMFFSFVGYYMIHSKNHIIYFIIMTVLSLALYSFFKDYNGGENVFNELIISRLEYIDNSFIGDNRVSLYVDRYYSELLSNNEMYFGIGEIAFNTKFIEGGSGYKVFIISHGIFGLLLFVSFYYMIMKNYKSKMVVIYFLLFMLSFLQRSYSLWDYQLIVYILGIPYIKKDSLV